MAAADARRIGLAGYYAVLLPLLFVVAMAGIGTGSTAVTWSTILHVVANKMLYWNAAGVNDGDSVSENQEMVEVMTDKATVTIGAPKTGKVTERRYKVGDTVPVGDVLVVLEVGGE